ncbi:MAG TPA: FtsX-like permease family protein [Gammaproteobacteria bacterium]
MLHAGEFGVPTCTSDGYREWRGALERIRHPVVFTPGDGDWKDCSSSSEVDVDTRLYTLRNVRSAAIPAAVRAGMMQFGTLLSITVSLLLVAGCLTAGMLLLVRTEDRRDELAECLALGATRSRLAAGIAAEATILSVLGAVLAIPVSALLYHGVRGFGLPGGIDIELLELSFDFGAWFAIAGAALAITCTIAMLATVLGLAGHRSLRVQSSAVATPATHRGLRTALLAGQVAITLVLVAGAGLFARSLATALSLNAELESSHIVTADVSLRSLGYTSERAIRFFDELRDRLQTNGTIASVSIAQPEGGTFAERTIDGVPRQMPSFLRETAIDEAYFSTFGLPIVEGRGLTRADTAGAPLVVVVSESFGRLIAGDGSPLGHRITEGGGVVGAERPVAEVVGVVADVITDVNTTEPLAMYYPLAQRTRQPFATLVVRAAGDPRATMREVTAVLSEMDPRVTPAQMSTLYEQIGRQMSPQRFGMYVLGMLGGIALVLAVLATYVVAASMVVGRRREMSIRAALGARGTQLGAIVLRDTVRLVGIGLAAGIALALLGAKTIRGLLYQVEPLEPAVLASTASLILACALLVSLKPAVEAARLDLTRSLRDE